MAEAKMQPRWRASLRHLLRRARDFVVMLADPVVIAAARMLPPRRGRGLAIIMVHGLGDLVLFSPALAALRAHYRDRPLTLVCSPAGANFARTMLGLEQLVVVDRAAMRRSLPRRAAALWAMARAGAGLVLQPSFNRDLLIEDALVRASGAAERLGSTGTPLFLSPRERRRGDRWYTRLLPEPPGPMHDTERYAALCRTLTGEPLADILPRLPHPPCPPVAPPGDYLVLAISASAPIREWPLERFLAVVGAEAGSLPVLLVGQRGSGALPPLPAGLRLLDLRGRTSLAEFDGLIAHARLLLGNDSGPVHLAAAFGVPAVAVAGSGLLDRYLPYPAGGAGPRVVTTTPAPSCAGCGWQCRYALPAGTPAPCIASVPEEMVRQALAAALAAG